MPDDDLYLAGTSEVPLASLHAGEIFAAESLPRRYAGFSTCFRREAGAAGKDTKGIFRVHQFDKVEMFTFVEPDDSAAEHERLLAIEEEILGALGIPYRVVNIAANDLGASAAKKYDLEAWLPGQGRYRELTSCSNTTDYQARRLDVRFRPGEEAPRHVHTLNGTAVAVGRTIIALAENGQQEDGSVAIPAVLQEYGAPKEIRRRGLIQALRHLGGRMDPQSDTAAMKLARVARRAHGVVTRSEALGAGLSATEIRDRVRSGALLRVHRGVYRVGHRAPSTEATFIAAVRACGPGAALSGRAAAHLLGLIKGPPPPPEVTAPGRRRVAGVRTRRGRPDRTLWRGIPVTSVPTTLVDLAAVLPEDDLARAFHEAGIRHHTTPQQVEAVLARRPNSPGAAALRHVIGGDTPVSLSRLESRFRSLLNERRLPLPETNRPAGAHRVDARWPRHRLTVELDSYRYHRSRHAWEQDRRREREAHARGDQHRRFTHDDVFGDPTEMLAELSVLLSDR